MADDWFRNTTWSDEVAQDFDAKLLRARRKDQYLRIQASTIAVSHPAIALRLLDRYFELPDTFDDAQAFVDRATAFRSLGLLDDAVAAYEAALAREDDFPNVLTQAYIQLPFIIATAPLPALYDRAMELLELHQDRITFPVEQFCWSGARALILADLGKPGDAAPDAKSACEAARLDDSGFRYHQKVGLVGDQYDSVLGKLLALADA